MAKKSLVLLLLALPVSLVAFFSLRPATNNPPLKSPDWANYEALWKKVDSLDEKQLPQSAQALVLNIYAKSKKEKNPPQQVKSLIYLGKYSSELSEDRLIAAIHYLEKEIASLEFPARAIMSSRLADIYWTYYQLNTWRIRDRTEMEVEQSEDISTWTLERLANRIIRLHQQALTPADSLKQYDIRAFMSILDTSNGSGKYRPTLYDLLAWQAIQFYENDLSGITRPADQFVLRDPEAFATSAVFIDQDFNSSDSLRLKWRALQLFQELERFHLDDANATPLVDAALHRLEFARQHALLDVKDSLYYEALDKLQSTHNDLAIAAEVLAKMASFHRQRAWQYQTEKATIYKDANNQALALCDQAIEKYHGSYGAQWCMALKADILAPNFNMQMESVITPGQVFPVMVEYSNIPALSFKIVRINAKQRAHLDTINKPEHRIAYLNTLKETAHWSVQLPRDPYHNQRRVEIKGEIVPKGDYILIATPNKDFSPDSTGFVLAGFQVSDLAFVQRRRDNGDIEVLVMERISGKPVDGAAVILTRQEYNRTTRSNDYIREGVVRTNKQGIAVLHAPDQYRNFFVAIGHKGDTLQADDYFYQGGPPSSEIPKWDTRMHFFLDRKIYRPGQTIYFKGIAIESKEKDHRLKTGYKTTVALYDVNGQKVSEQILKTNDYGSISGTFTAPQGLLNGQMRLQTDDGSIYFSVEEYKRPKFEVTFEEVNGSYKLGEKVTVSGLAKSYAGANLDNVPVRYRVVRQTAYPYYRWYWGWMPPSEEMEIANGEMRTDENGQFNVTFTAIPDETVQRKWKPQFNYTVYADVIDISGETQSGSQSVSVGTVALLVDVPLAEQVNAQKLDTLSINTTNLNGVFEPAKGTVKIWRLQEPDRVLRTKFWEAPDTSIYSQSEYYKLFPYDAWKEEYKFQNWPKGGQVFSADFNTADKKYVLITDAEDWEQGKYLIEVATKDAFGEAVHYEKAFTLNNRERNRIPLKETLWVNPLKVSGQPGEIAEIEIGTAEKEIMAFYQVEQDGKLIRSEWIKIKQGRKKIDIPITEASLGNLVVTFTTVKNARLYQETVVVNVPWTAKELKMEFATFRDKLQPGKEEQWQVKISGAKGEKVAAEMLAAMYDASLDAFASNSYALSIYSTSTYSRFAWQATRSFGVADVWNYAFDWRGTVPVTSRGYDQWSWFGWDIGNFMGRYRFEHDMNGNISYQKGEAMEDDMDGTFADVEESFAWNGSLPPAMTDSAAINRDKEVHPAIRKNLQETAFFFPHLQTDEFGSVIFTFTVPDALTRWKFLSLAHTKDLRLGSLTRETVTQKELMVMPNPPRFLRQGDRLTFTAKVNNLSEKSLTGSGALHFFDALTMQPIDGKLITRAGKNDFEIKAGQSGLLSWELSIPDDVQAVTYRISASAGNFTDGEESTIPVLTNRMLVTESIPLYVRGKETKIFTLDKLLNYNSNTLKHERLTLEFTSNPAWYAIQALPYLMEYPYACSEQIFSRYYANSLATHIANKNPRIKQVFDQWRTAQPDALLSNLEKNEELKSLLLEETPWVMEAKDESEQKRRIALLFDLNRMAGEQGNAMRQLQKAQTSGGGWPWFPGMQESEYITRHIIAGMGHLDHLGVQDIKADRQTWNMVQNGLSYLDREMLLKYNRLLQNKGDMVADQLTYDAIHYLYTRSFFPDFKPEAQFDKMYDFYLQQANKYWPKKSLYMQGMIALALHRANDLQTPGDILKSLRERAFVKEETGMYWQVNNGGYYWYQAPIETQALLIEAFEEIGNDTRAVDDMKVWLLKQKQTQNWPTTKATAEACYALLLSGDEWIASTELAQIKVGDKILDPARMPEVSIEAGTGYFKTSWTGSDISRDMGKVTVTNNSTGIGWGGLYWQYFEDMDKITPHQTPMQLQKMLFLETASPMGPRLVPVNDGTTLHPGDKIVVRIVLKADRDLEYVHMKDMRASGLEPVNVISSYKWQDGLGYYESTRDASTNFFMDRLPKGTYVFEYPLRVNLAGDFSNGITTIQCMYAPEFTAHSEGVRVIVK